MARTTSSDIARVEKLIERIVAGYADAEAAALELLANRDYKTVRFSTCHNFWQARIQQTNVGIPVMKLGAFIMYEEGETPRRVAGVIVGLGISTAVALHRQWENGDPSLPVEQRAEQASYTDRVAVPIRPNPTQLKPKMVVYNIPRDEYYGDRWEDKAAQLGVTLSELSYKTMQTAMAKIKIK